jgi:hypothetical protein
MSQAESESITKPLASNDNLGLVLGVTALNINVQRLNDALRAFMSVSGRRPAARHGAAGR